jgi:hypothetical protein
MKLKFARSEAAEWNDEQFYRRGGVRTECKGFSFGSRRRMLDRLNSVSVAAELPQFFTATLPDEVFNDSVTQFAKDAKHWLDTFIKRLVRIVPGASGFWRIEWQSRKSGRYEGKLFPHFHVLVWGLPERSLGERAVVDRELGTVGYRELREAYVPCEDLQLSLDLLGALSSRKGSTDATLLPGELLRVVRDGRRVYRFKGSRIFQRRVEHLQHRIEVARFSPREADRVESRNMSFQDWASLAWYHVVGSNRQAHLKAGVRVERVRTWGGVMCYCAKYMAKTDAGFMEKIAFGRSWGVFNRALVPWAKMVELDLGTDEGVRIRRIARHYLERRLGRRVRASHGITLYCDVQQFRRLWERPPPDPF